MRDLRIAAMVMLVLSYSAQRCAADDAAKKADDGFRPLFNGKNLDGWVPVNTAPSTWSVKDGMLICSGKPIGELRTDRMYQNFELEVEWRHMRPRGNAGIFVWADDITARGQPFHRSIEVQVLENAYGNTRGYTTHGDIFPIHGAKMTPLNGRGGSRSFPTENRSKPSPQWNHYRIRCVDGAISLAVNGKVVTEGKDCSPRKGYICLESEGGIVHYRNLRIRELPSTPVAQEHIAIADRGYRCLYNGIDLAGWKVEAGKTTDWKPSDWTLRYVGSGKGVLASEERFKDVGFLFDVRRKKTSGTLSVLFRGATGVVIDPTGKPGQWNRFEGELRGDRLTVRLNGQEVFTNRQLDAPETDGPLSFAVEGPIDIANVFVRSLKDK